MTKKEPTNVAASVMNRLLNRSKKTGDDYQTMLIAYVCERFLFRLGSSAARERFVLKGAMLLRVWSEHHARTRRATRYVWRSLAFTPFQSTRARGARLGWSSSRRL